MRQPSWALPVVSSLLLAGCAVGPNYKRPQAAVPTQWTVAPTRGTETKSPETDEWWASFQDPELNSLVERSASRNLDLKLALERVQKHGQRVALLGRVIFLRSTARPPALAIARGSSRQSDRKILPSSFLSNSIIFRETFPLLGNWMSLEEPAGAWQAATADATAAEENRRDVLVILLGDVGRVYAQLRGFQRRLEIANKNIKTQQDTLDLTSARAKAGLATELDVSRAAAQLESTRAIVPSLLSGIDVSIHRLSVLLGEEPGALRSELEKASPIPSAGPEVDVGLPSDLLKRRPDIRRSERNWLPRQPDR